MRKRPPVDHLRPRRSRGPADRLCGTRADSQASARHPTAADRPGCVPCDGEAHSDSLYRGNTEFRAITLAAWKRHFTWPSISVITGQIIYITKLKSAHDLKFTRLPVTKPARKRMAAGDLRRQHPSFPDVRGAAVCCVWRTEKIRQTPAPRKTAAHEKKGLTDNPRMHACTFRETHPLRIIPNHGEVTLHPRAEINEGKIVHSRNGFAHRIPDDSAPPPRVSRRSRLAASNSWRSWRPTGNQPEPSAN